jgi:hypothetical protein
MKERSMSSVVCSNPSLRHHRRGHNHPIQLDYLAGIVEEQDPTSDCKRSHRWVVRISANRMRARAFHQCLDFNEKTRVHLYRTDRDHTWLSRFICLLLFPTTDTQRIDLRRLSVSKEHLFVSLVLLCHSRILLGIVGEEREH